MFLLVFLFSAIKNAASWAQIFSSEVQSATIEDCGCSCFKQPLVCASPELLESQAAYTTAFPHYHLQNFPLLGIEKINANYGSRNNKTIRELLKDKRVFTMNEHKFLNELIYMELNFAKPKGSVKSYQLSSPTFMSALDNPMLTLKSAEAFAHTYFDSLGNFVARCGYTKFTDSLARWYPSEKYFRATHLRVVERTDNKVRYIYYRVDSLVVPVLNKDWAAEQAAANEKTIITIEAELDANTQEPEKVLFYVFSPKKTSKTLHVKEIRYTKGEAIDTQRHYFYAPYFAPNSLLTSEESACSHCIVDTSQWLLLFTSLHDKEGNLIYWEHTYWIEKMQRLYACLYLHNISQINTYDLQASKKFVVPPAPPAFDAVFHIKYKTAGMPESVKISNEKKYLGINSNGNYTPYTRPYLLDYCEADFNFSQEDTQGNWQECQIKPRCIKRKQMVNINYQNCDCCGDAVLIQRKISYYAKK